MMVTCELKNKNNDVLKVMVKIIYCRYMWSNNVQTHRVSVALGKHEHTRLKAVSRSDIILSSKLYSL